jgi:pimeloyl-ACP methyl ester carboxylesterase
VNIAYWTLGEGPPLVIMPTLPISHIAREWEIYDVRRWYERLGTRRMIVRYDARNTGSSDRGLTEDIGAGWERDLEAVVNALQQPAVDLFATTASGPPAIAFASRNPSCVGHLVFWHAHARGSDIYDAGAVRIAQTMIDDDWFVFCQLLARAECGWIDTDFTQDLIQMYFEASSPDGAKVGAAAVAANDSSRLLPTIGAPALVLHRSGVHWVDMGITQRLAAGLPHAELVILEGTASAPFMGDSDAVLAEVARFLDEADSSRRCVMSADQQDVRHNYA